MRILRVRRGFTTNSSGSNEFLPDGTEIPYDGGTPGDGGVRRRDGGPEPVLTAVRPFGERPAVTPPPAGGSSTLALVAAAVAGAFLVVPIARYAWRRRKRKEPARDDD